MYETRDQPIISRRAFLGRMARHGGLALSLIVGSLAVGMIGYIGLAGLGPVDAFLNAAMLLGGMGPVSPLDDDAAKLFAGLFALYSGMVFLAVAAVMGAPLLHRVLHRFHLESSDGPAASPD